MPNSLTEMKRNIRLLEYKNGIAARSPGRNGPRADDSVILGIFPPTISPQRLPALDEMHGEDLRGCICGTGRSADQGIFLSHSYE